MEEDRKNCGRDDRGGTKLRHGRGRELAISWAKEWGRPFRPEAYIRTITIT